MQTTFFIIFCIFGVPKARMAKPVDAHDSGSCVRKDVQVRILFRALIFST